MNIKESYVSQLQSALESIDETELYRAFVVLKWVRAGSGTAYIFGNGGSASTANHFANDLNKLAGSVSKHRLLPAISLCTNEAVIMALANDMAYANVFKEQLRYHAKPNDTAIGISCSGTSPNVVNALRYADKVLDIQTMLITGNPRPIDVEYCDTVLYVDNPDIRIQEDVHLAYCHMLAGALRDND